MLTHWTNLFKSGCKVVRIGKDYVYPIFKCGSTTLFVNADQILVNEELQNLSTIKIIIRITADNPLIDPNIVDNAIEKFNKRIAMNFFDISLAMFFPDVTYDF